MTGGGDGKRCKEVVQELFRQTMDLNPSTCPFQDEQCSFAQVKRGAVRGNFLVRGRYELSDFRNFLPSSVLQGTGALYYDAKNLHILSNNSFSLRPFDAAGFRQGTLIVSTFYFLYFSRSSDRFCYLRSTDLILQ